MVLPDGTLFGEGVKTRIKQELLEKCNLHTIVRLPNGVFAPYTGIPTNILFFDRSGPTSGTAEGQLAGLAVWRQTSFLHLILPAAPSACSGVVRSPPWPTSASIVLG